ncbi:hypothetical protein [Oryza sativa Japonica Group]|uniref:Uncharacterized protein P0504E02.20 n=1 Tax=Oryza sativa subsp. japonica TaxID=39947 RepID=Q8S1U5_ORYSJ|nr:hypothetical protein [Oryza sativa Japonica Group]
MLQCPSTPLRRVAAAAQAFVTPSSPTNMSRATYRFIIWPGAAREGCPPPNPTGALLAAAMTRRHEGDEQHLSDNR